MSAGQFQLWLPRHRVRAKVDRERFHRVRAKVERERIYRAGERCNYGTGR